MQEHHTKKQSFLDWVRQCIKSHRTLTVVTLVLVAVAVIWAATTSGSPTSRTASYKKVSGAAGLDAIINYDCKKPCKQKYNFNVYIFDGNGQQVNIVRPDSSGRVRMAVSEGKYVMLIGKSLGKDGLFPQEKLTLKNGQQLDLTLHYKEGTL